MLKLIKENKFFFIAILGLIAMSGYECYAAKMAWLYYGRWGMGGRNCSMWRRELY
jgi:hypothetical protein